MSTFKKLNKQDAFITTYTAHKSWVVSGSQFADYGIQIIPSVNGIYLNSLQQLYYPTKISGSITSHSFDYYDQSTLYNSQSRHLTTGSFVISLPRNVVGTHINPGIGMNFYINDVQEIRYVSQSYWGDGYVDDPIVFNNVDILGLIDDGEGNLYKSGSNPRDYLGDIIYPHGMVIITDPDYALLLQQAWAGYNPFDELELEQVLGRRGTATRNNLQLRWESSQPIFTHNYHCKVRDFELNYTNNPSANSSSLGPIYDNNSELYSTSGSINKGDLQNNITGSEFTPYFTSVGLYNDANELIAVAKTSRPIPKSTNTDMTIIVKIDI
jgi:hypothetical protein